MLQSHKRKKIEVGNKDKTKNENEKQNLFLCSPQKQLFMTPNHVGVTWKSFRTAVCGG